MGEDRIEGGQLSHLMRRPQPPQCVGRWTRGESIGRGGQSRVYHATDGEGGPVRALKLVWVPQDLAQKKARFIREIRQHRHLSDAQTPAIVPIIDTNLDLLEQGAEWGFIVMPRAASNVDAEANSLVGRVELSLEIFSGLLVGVREAHGIGIVHRDIKPANILFLDSGLRRPVLADFGICFVRGDPRITLEGETVGARFFMAPEQERGGVVDVDARADIYSLGKLLHFMLTGRRLFREELDSAFHPAELEADRRLSVVLEDVLKRTIVTAPDGRFGSVEPLIDAIEKIRRGPSSGPGLGSVVPRPIPTPTSERRSSGAVEPGVSSPSHSVRSAFADATMRLEGGRLPSLKLLLDRYTANFRAEWQDLYLKIQSNPEAAPAAAKELTTRTGPVAGILLAICRFDSNELFDEVKALLEKMLRVSEERAGYLAVHGVPYVPAGFLYMMLSVAALHWRSWKTLGSLLNEKFEWYYQSGRPLYDYGFHQAYFFHSDALGRKADVAHNLYREILSQPDYIDVLGLTGEELLNTYLQAQMIHSLRAAQEAEKGEGSRMWADFGRFRELRVVPLLDRFSSNEAFARDLAAVFQEHPDVWLSKLNDRLNYIQTHFWGGANYSWDSISRYERR